MVPAIASSAVSLAATYGPAVVDKANAALAKVTGGKVKSMGDLVGYVGKNPDKLAIASGALVSSGFNPRDLFPADLVGSDARLQQLRSDALALAGRLRSQFESGSDKTLEAGHIPEIVIAIKRVRAALEVYGSEQRYFLVNPNGGIPAREFDMYRAIKAAV